MIERIVKTARRTPKPVAHDERHPHEDIVSWRCVLECGHSGTYAVRYCDLDGDEDQGPYPAPRKLRCLECEDATDFTA